MKEKEALELRNSKKYHAQSPEVLPEILPKLPKQEIGLIASLPAYEKSPQGTQKFDSYLALT